MKPLLVLVTLGLALRVDATPQKTSTVEVCPPLRSATPILQFWEEEELWPQCSIASPIASIGGRCLDGTACMQPCSATVEDGGKLTEDSTYRYAKGRLVSATQISHFGDKPFETKTECKRDAHGHLSSCTTADSPARKYIYAHGRLERVAERKFKRDGAGRLVTESWDNGTTISYAYNADGTLATEVTKFTGNMVTTKLAYDKGHVTAVHTKPSDPGFGPTDIAYDYDKAGRVIRETERRGAHDAAPAGTTRIEPSPAETDTYTYDDEGRLTQQSRDLGSSKIVTTYRYECH